MNAMTLTNSLTAKHHTGHPATPALSLPRLFEGESALIALGLLGVMLSALLSIVYLVSGPVIGPEGHLNKAIQFDLALGLFLVNVAAILPLAGFARPWRAAFRWTSFALALYSYGIETIQILRGIDPRFSRQFKSLTDALPSIIFAMVSLLLILLIIVLFVQFMRASVKTQRWQMVLANRYGMAATLFALGGGIWMMGLKGHQVGTSGSALWIHFVGFVGLKVMSITGYLAERAQGAGNEPWIRRMVHLAGVSWLAFCSFVSWQTALGLNVFVPTAISLAGAVSLLTCVFAAGSLALRLRTLVHTAR